MWAKVLVEDIKHFLEALMKFWSNTTGTTGNTTGASTSKPTERQSDAPSQFTKNFCLTMLTQSDTATRLGINNSPIANGELFVVNNLEQLSVKVLEPVFALLKGDYMYSGGYRCKPLNDAVGSSDSSQHRKGMANDFQPKVPTKANVESAFQAIKASDIPFDQLIIEGSRIGTPQETFWIHISYDPNKAQQRRQTLRVIVGEDGKNRTVGA